MLFSLLISALLLATIGGMSHPSVQTLCHAGLTALCLLAGQANAASPTITFASIGVTLVSGVALSIILKRQSFQRSFIELFVGLFFILLAILLVAYVLPPSLPRLEYGIVLSIILIAMLYSTFSKTIGGQVAGVACALNALSLVLGLNGQYFAFAALVVFYGVFLLMSSMVVARLG